MNPSGPAVAGSESGSKRVFSPVLCAGLLRALVFSVIDIPALMILLPVNLFPFRASQLAAIRVPVGSHFLVDRRLIAFKTRRLSRVQTPRADALSDSILLVLLTLPYFAIAKVVRRGIVFVFIDLLTEAVLLAVNALPFSLGQLAVVRFAVRPDLAVQRPFLVLQACGFTRFQLSRLYPLGDAILLVFPTVVHLREAAQGEQSNAE